MSYIAERIREEEWYGRTCRVNYLSGVTKEKTEEWFHIMEKENYQLMWFSKKQIIFRNKQDKHFICIIETSFQVKARYMERYFPMLYLLTKQLQLEKGDAQNENIDIISLPR